MWYLLEYLIWKILKDCNKGWRQDAFNSAVSPSAKLEVVLGRLHAQDSLQLHTNRQIQGDGRDIPWHIVAHSAHLWHICVYICMCVYGVGIEVRRWNLGRIFSACPCGSARHCQCECSTWRCCSWSGCCGRSGRACEGRSGLSEAGGNWCSWCSLIALGCQIEIFTVIHWMWTHRCLHFTFS